MICVVRQPILIVRFENVGPNRRSVLARQPVGVLAGSGTSGLAPRQLDVLHQFTRGLPNKQIARGLRLTQGPLKIDTAALRTRSDAAPRSVTYSDAWRPSPPLETQ